MKQKRALRPISSGVLELNTARSFTPSIEAVMRAHSLKHREPQKDVRLIIAYLLKGKPSDRKDACVDLAELVKTDPKEAKKAAPALIIAYNESTPLTKMVILEAFALINDDGSFQQLLGAARDDNELIREKAQILLRMINSQEMCI
jgi:hypothetical protein